METYKNRPLTKGQRVKVYFNLQKKKFSVVSLEGENKDRVVAHTENIRLVDCFFKVGAKGRERVLRENQKNVHAYVFGEYAGLDVRGGELAFYNPYLYDSFVLEDGKPLDKHQEVSLVGKKIFLN